MDLTLLSLSIKVSSLSSSCCCCSSSSSSAGTMSSILKSLTLFSACMLGYFVIFIIRRTQDL